MGGAGTPSFKIAIDMNETYSVIESVLFILLFSINQMLPQKVS
jgi:hypothetical protein